MRFEGDHLLFLVKDLLFIAGDGAIILLSFLVEGALNFGVDGCVFVEEVGDGFKVDLILDVFQHHLVVAQLDNQLTCHLSASLIFILKTTETLASCRLAVL